MYYIIFTSIKSIFLREKATPSLSECYVHNDNTCCDNVQDSAVNSALLYDGEGGGGIFTASCHNKMPLLLKCNFIL